MARPCAKQRQNSYRGFDCVAKQDRSEISQNNRINKELRKLAKMGKRNA